MNPFTIVIPARYGSSRLPGKPLISLGGKPMIQHVYERALKCGAQEVLIATDDERIERACTKFGAKVLMTSPKHENGTERLCEVARVCNWSDDIVVVNVQGDEPLVPIELIATTANGLIEHPQAGISSLCVPITEHRDAFDPNVVKVVLNAQGFALYFSRAPIGWHRDQFQTFADQPLRDYRLADNQILYRHIGMYGYRVSFLRQYADMKPSMLELNESLEQLRALHYGVPIHMSVIDQAPAHGVDTPADIERIEALLAQH